MPYPVSFPTGQSNKVHHSYIWLRSLVALGAMVVLGGISNIQGIASLAILASESGANVLIIAVLILLTLVIGYAVAVGISVLAYRNLSYVFDEREFSLYSGIITKRRVHVPYARVQSVNHKQSLIQRLAGVCTVEIDTAGGSSNKAVRVPYVLLGTGEAIRQDLFVRKAASLNGEQVVNGAGFGSVPGAPNASAAPPVPAALAGSASAAPAVLSAPAAPTTPSASASAAPYAPTASAAPRFDARGNILDAASAELGVDGFRGVFDSQIAGMEPVSFERRLSNGELGLCCVSNKGALLTAFSGAAVLIVTLLGFLYDNPYSQVALIILIPLLVGACVFALVASLVAVALTYGNFSVRRRGNRIEVERGILQRDFTGIDIDRIQSVVVRQSVLRKLMGYCELSVGRINAAGDKNSRNNSAKLNNGALVIHPFLKVDQVDAVLNGLLPEFADRPARAQFKGLPKVALRRGIIRRCILRNGYLWTMLIVLLYQIAIGFVAGSQGVANASNMVNLLEAFNAICSFVYVLCLVATALRVWGTIWWQKGSGFALAERYLALHNDGLGTETVWLPRQKIQDVFTCTNPFQRAAGVATICARTAAGITSTRTQLWDVEQEDGRAWLQWAIPRT